MGAFSLAMVQTRRAKQGGMGYQCWQEKDEKKGIEESGSQITKNYYMGGKNAADKLMLAISRSGLVLGLMLLSEPLETDPKGGIYVHFFCSRHKLGQRMFQFLKDHAKATKATYIGLRAASAGLVPAYKKHYHLAEKHPHNTGALSKLNKNTYKDGFWMCTKDGCFAPGNGARAKGAWAKGEVGVFRLLNTP